MFLFDGKGRRQNGACPYSATNGRARRETEPYFRIAFKASDISRGRVVSVGQYFLARAKPQKTWSASIRHAVSRRSGLKCGPPPAPPARPSFSRRPRSALSPCFLCFRRDDGS